MNNAKGRKKEESMTVSTDKQKALESAMSQVERQFGKGSIMKLGSRPIVSVRSFPPVSWR